MPSTHVVFCRPKVVVIHFVTSLMESVHDELGSGVPVAVPQPIPCTK